MSKVFLNKEKRSVRITAETFKSRKGGLGDPEVQIKKAKRLSDLYMDLNATMSEIAHLFEDDNEQQMATRLQSIGEVLHVFVPGEILRKGLYENGLDQKENLDQVVSLIDVRKLYAQLKRSGVWDRLKSYAQEKEND